MIVWRLPDRGARVEMDASGWWLYHGRLDDAEDKWIVTPEGCSFTEEEIRETLRFQEQYFRSELWF